MRDGCVFCDYAGPSAELAEGVSVIGGGLEFPYFVIEPLNPVTAGHLLVVPRGHINDFRHHPIMLGAMMQVAADVAGDLLEDEGEGEKPGCNLIASAGAAATQTVGHLHVHVVPRREGDGLLLPWSKR